MGLALIGAVADSSRMSKKKPSGDHQKKRIGVNMPEEWHALARKLAAEGRQPVLWYLIGLVQTEAKKKGYETPVAPWEEEAEGGTEKPKK